MRAFRKPHNYGTIVIDLETQRPIDLLPDRESKTVAEWFKAHSGVNIVARDRSEGVKLGAPAAEQVADRWHLLKNVVDVLKDFLNQHHPEFHKARRVIIERNSKTATTIKMPTTRRGRAREQTRQKRLELYRKIQTLIKDEVQPRYL